MENKDKLEQLMLMNSEGIGGSNGRNITYRVADKMEPCECFGMKGFRIEWIKRKNMPPTFIPMTNVSKKSKSSK
jgi:hypothetical protein